MSFLDPKHIINYYSTAILVNSRKVFFYAVYVTETEGSVIESTLHATPKQRGCGIQAQNTVAVNFPSIAATSERIHANNRP